MTLTADTAGRARSPGLSYQELLDNDSRPVPDVLRWQSSDSFGQDDKPVDRYIAREIHELEKERLWTKVWQMVCRESELAEVGDTQVYDITDISILLVRTSPTEIKAFYNACLHRGRQLRELPGPVTELRCPFHGYAWNLDGSLKQVPCQWDFPQVVARGVPPARGQGRHLGWFRLHQHGSEGGAVRLLPRRSLEALRALAAGEALQAGPRRPDPADQLEDGAGGVHGGLPRRRDAPAAARRASVTPTASTTCGATSAAPSHRTARRART